MGMVESSDAVTVTVVEVSSARNSFVAGDGVGRTFAIFKGRTRTMVL